MKRLLLLALSYAFFLSAIAQDLPPLSPITASNCKPKDNYTFDQKLECEVYAYKIGETDTMKMDMTNFYTTSGIYYAIEMVMPFGKTTNLMCLEDSSMTMLMDMKMQDVSYKTGLCKKINSNDIAQSSMSGNGFEVFNDTGFINQLKFTGYSKLILGYTCKEYSTSKNGNVWTIWASSELPVFSTPHMGNNDNLKQIGGILEMEILLSERKEIFKSKAISYSTENISITTTGYQF